MFIPSSIFILFGFFSLAALLNRFLCLVSRLLSSDPDSAVGPDIQTGAAFIGAMLLLLICAFSISTTVLRTQHGNERKLLKVHQPLLFCAFFVSEWFGLLLGWLMKAYARRCRKDSLLQWGSKNSEHAPAEPRRRQRQLTSAAILIGCMTLVMTGHDRERKIQDRAVHQQREETAGSYRRKNGITGHFWREGVSVK